MCSMLRFFALLLLVGCAWSQVFNQGLTANCKEPAGVPDKFQVGMCNCYSGFAPSSIESTDCNTHPRCAGLTTDADAVLGDNQPRRPTAIFNNDRLTIVQKSPIVSNRKGSKIHFVEPLIRGMPGNVPGRDGADTCAYPGVLWTKTVDTLDCLDVFTASIPWSQSQFCGFVKDTNSSSVQKIVLKSTLVHEYNETHHFNNKAYDRNLKSSYLITVSFLAQKTLSTNADNLVSVTIPDTTAPGFLKVAVVSHSIYDVASGQTFVEFRTTALWPYQLANAASFKAVVPTIAGLGAVTIENLDGDENPECEMDQDSDCTQRWKVVIPADAETCDIAGKYTFTDDLLCRDVSGGSATTCPGAAVAPVDFDINVKATNLCAPEALDATATSSYVLSPFFAEEDTTETWQYQTGDWIYWDLSVTDPLVSIESIHFQDISVTLNVGGVGVSTDVLLSNSGLTAKGSGVALNISKEIEYTVAPGHAAVLKFKYQLLRSILSAALSSLGSVSGGSAVTTVQITTSVTVNVQYHGNQHTREIEEVEEITAAKSKSTIAQSRTIQLIITPDNIQQAHNNNNEQNNLLGEDVSSASTISPLFGLFVALFVAFALKF